MLWFAAAQFGDEGSKFRSQVKKSVLNGLRLGFERGSDREQTFAVLYSNWAEGDHHAPAN